MGKKFCTLREAFGRKTPFGVIKMRSHLKDLQSLRRKRILKMEGYFEDDIKGRGGIGKGNDKEGWEERKRIRRGRMG